MAPIIETHPILGLSLLFLGAAALFLASNFRELFVKEKKEKSNKVLQHENNPK